MHSKHSLFDGRRGVSPVIGVVLMVVIVVILAAVVATFALGFNDELQQPVGPVNLDVTEVEDGVIEASWENGGGNAEKIIVTAQYPDGSEDSETLDGVGATATFSGIPDGTRFYALAVGSDGNEQLVYDEVFAVDAAPGGGGSSYINYDSDSELANIENSCGSSYTISGSKYQVTGSGSCGPFFNPGVHTMPDFTTDGGDNTITITLKGVSFYNGATADISFRNVAGGSTSTVKSVTVGSGDVSGGEVTVTVDVSSSSGGARDVQISPNPGDTDGSTVDMEYDVIVVEGSS